MTRFILVGGYPRKANDHGKAFCRELVRGFKTPVRILDCLFARPEETWHEDFQEDKKFFKKFLSPKNFEIRLADPNKFTDQIEWTDTVYLRGGETDKLRHALRNYEDWSKELEGKTVAGTSAGANLIARYNYGLHSLKIEDGFGLLPVKVIVHYQSSYNAPHIDWGKALADLKKHKEDLPVIPLKEGEFRVIEG